MFLLDPLACCANMIDIIIELINLVIVHISIVVYLRYYWPDIPEIFDKDSLKGCCVIPLITFNTILSKRNQ